MLTQTRQVLGHRLADPDAEPSPVEADTRNIGPTRFAHRVVQYYDLEPLPTKLQGVQAVGAGPETLSVARTSVLPMPASSGTWSHPPRGDSVPSPRTPPPTPGLEGHSAGLCVERLIQQAPGQAGGGREFFLHIPGPPVGPGAQLSAQPPADPPHPPCAS